MHQKQNSRFFFRTKRWYVKYFFFRENNFKVFEISNSISTFFYFLLLWIVHQGTALSRMYSLGHFLCLDIPNRSTYYLLEIYYNLFTDNFTLKLSCFLRHFEMWAHFNFAEKKIPGIWNVIIFLKIIYKGAMMENIFSYLSILVSFAEKRL